ncbi:MAG: AsmA family protein [Bdellovibrionales bacterium]|nr:AsmA family protein [Bdellovibrionales bacterium]
MKKIMKVFGVLAAVILVALITIPFFVNVDKFRPEIVKAVNSKLNGTLELGKLSLSLWGRIHVGVDGLKVTDSKGAPVLSVKDAAFDMPYLSVLSGSPLITIGMKEPEIRVLKDKEGKLNVMSLMKTETGSSGTGADQKKESPPSGQVELPGLAVNAHFGISIENAKLVYQDQAMDLTNTVDRLNVRVKDFSLSRKTEMELWAELKTKMGTDLELEGPLTFKMALTPEISGGEFKKASLEADFSADELSIRKGDLFTKKKGVPTRLDFNASLDTSALTLKEAMIRFHNAEILLSGIFHKDQGADFKFEAKPVDLKPWNELVPILKEYELEGKLGLKGGLKGKPDSLQYEAMVNVDGLTAKGPMLKAKPVLNGSIHVLTDQIEKLALELKAPGNGLTLDAKVRSFSKPQVTFALNSAKGMDLDQWVEFPADGAGAKGSKDQAPASDAKSGAQAKEEDLDALLDPLRKNEIARDLTLDGSVSIAFLRAKGFRMDDLRTKIQMKNLVVALSDIKLKMYEGTMSGNFSVDLKPKEPFYSMNFMVAGFDMQKAVESQFQSFKNTLTGVLSAAIQGSGASFNSKAAKRQLKMKGNFKVVNASFRSMDISKMANEAISGSLGKIADKVPVLRGKDLKVNSNADSKYDLISGSFTISNGTLEAPDFVAKAAPKRGVDLKGFTRMGLIDESLDAKWELTDTQRVTGADQLTVNIAGKNIPNFLAKSEKDPVTLPITVGCKWSAPCMNYGQVPEFLAGVAAKRLGNVAQDVVKQKVQDSVKGAIEKGVGNAIKGLFGR